MTARLNANYSVPLHRSSYHKAFPRQYTVESGGKKGECRRAEENRGKHGKQEKTIEKIKRKIYIGVHYLEAYMIY